VYQASRASGQIELSTTPFYHPILPLLCDTDVHLVAHPEHARPARRFSYPDDARLQVERAVTFHRRTFGEAPAGMWPSEGSVSDAIVPVVAAAGLRWMATDEDVLARTLRRPLGRDGFGHVERAGDLYRPYRVRAGGAEVVCLFRDHLLSDRIGFTYQSWDAGHAADEFVGRVREAGRRFTAETGDAAVVTVILDGENAWEHYAGGGRPFLRTLYQRLQDAPDIETVTMSEAAASPTAAVLEGVFPGSWINADFSIWAGHRDDQTAWSVLAAARETLAARAATAGSEAVVEATEELMIAEGSDWFWWYGDDHSSAQDAEFDELFRRHVSNVYRALGVAVPEQLGRSLRTTGVTGAGGTMQRASGPS
jgi:alpha-amylase/alpha-mannosidase (GH57 family)